MPAFAFKAVDPAGRPQRGVIEASTMAGARRALRERNLLPVSVQTTAAAGAPAQTGVSRLLRRRVDTRALTAATRQLSTLIGADVRVEEALRIVAEQNAKAPMGAVLLNVRGAILEGRGFANALGDRPEIFPEFYRASIVAGEHSGRLAEVLAHLTVFVENRDRARQKIQLALIYPALLAVVSVSMIILLLVYVVPDIVKVFVSRGAELPFLTRGLIALSSGVQTYGLALAVFIALLIAGARYWLRKAENKLALARFVARQPPTARFSRQLNAARFAGSLSTLVRSDVPLVDALTAAAAVTPNRYIRERIVLATSRVREGASLQQSLIEADCFPPMLLAVVASGETSGRLGPALGRAAADMERELDALTAALVALVEPAVLLVMGGIVLLMVLSILMPIVSLNNLAVT